MLGNQLAVHDHENPRPNFIALPTPKRPKLASVPDSQTRTLKIQGGAETETDIEQEGDTTRRTLPS
jgi:hypothetical protein